MYLPYSFSLFLWKPLGHIASLVGAQALLVKSDCDSLGRKIDFTDIEAQDHRVGHVHNVTNQALPESREVNTRMLEFMDRCLR